MWIKNTLIMSICAVVLLSAPAVMASPFSLLLGGEADTEEQAYYYAGIVGEKRMGDNVSLMGRLWLDYLTYRFEKDSDIIKAKAPAVQPALGVKFFGDGWYTTLWAGWGHRNTVISPFRDDVKVKGVSDSLLLQVELDKWTKTSTNLSLIASYSTNDSYIWGRGRVKQEILPGGIPLRIGLELIGQGNRDYNALQVGPVVEICTLSRNASIALHGGYKYSSSISDSAYGGCELYYGF